MDQSLTQLSPISKPRIAVVLTREIRKSDSVGRIKTLLNVCNALETHYQTTYFRLQNLLEVGKPYNYVTTFIRALTSLMKLKPIPFQSLLHSAQCNLSQLSREISSGNFSAIYFDSVRTQLLLRRLQPSLANCRVVVDLDDLMSRRMELLLSSRQPISLGYLREKLPPVLARIIEGPLSRLITRYEYLALRNAEYEIAAAADVIVLVSSVERDLLAQRIPPSDRAKIHAIPPPARAIREPILTEPYRFLFVGSDSLLQNRLSIDFLLNLWDQLRPEYCLHIYGRQTRPTHQLRNIIWHGYIEDIADAYSPDTIMLLPTILPGGIKTKALEAWSFGRPVLGNATAFEGLGIEDYPLAIPCENWRSYVLTPQRHRGEFLQSANAGHSYVRDTLSPENYAQSWMKITSNRPS